MKDKKKMDNSTVFAGWEYVIEETANGPRPKKLGRGGFGSVFEIKKQGGIDFRSAMKVISVPRDESFVSECFSEGMDESQILQILEEEKNKAVREIQRQIEVKSNPNIVSIEDFAIREKKDSFGWDIFIRMELLTPVQELPATKLIQADVQELGIDICNALEECHRIGMLHRDIKPGNIFVDSNGHYKLGDFGISRVMDMTTGVVSGSGTQLYAAPEVISMEKNRVTTDIYSLGLVLYGLLNHGRLPFLPPAPEAVRRKDIEEAVLRRLSGEQIVPIDGVSDELNQIIRKACALDQKDRFSSAKEMKESLKSVIDFSRLEALFNDADEKENVDALFEEGVNYYRGRGVERDYIKAADCFKKVAEQGHADAQDYLGIMYLFGEGVSQDYVEAAKWVKMSAERGDAGAEFNLGLMHERGQGVRQDYNEALKWYQKAAEQGHVNAQKKMGFMYYDGRGVKQDIDEAIRLFQLAADQGDEDAKKLLSFAKRKKELLQQKETIVERMEDQKKDKPTEENGSDEIAIVGVGGAGCNIIDRMIAWDFYDLKYIAINTDKKALEKNKSEQKILIGERLLDGKGTGGDVEKGENAAIFELDEIIQALSGFKVVIIKCGLGSGTGSGAAPIIGKIAKNLGAFVFADAVYPFTFEGKNKREQADKSLVKLSQNTDITDLIRNDSMLEFMSDDDHLYSGFSTIDGAFASIDFLNYIFKEKNGRLDEISKDDFLEYYHRVGRTVWRNDNKIPVRDICEIQ